MNEHFLYRTFLGNSVENYLWCIGIILGGLIFRAIFSRLFSVLLFKLFQRYSSGVTDKEFHTLLKKPFSFFFLLVIFYIAFSHLTFPVEWNMASGEKLGARMIISKAYMGLVIVALSWILLRLIDFFGLILTYRAARTTSRLDDQLIPFFRDALKIFSVIFCFFLLLASVFNVNIVTLIGGLGIGGLAIALAAKETLENLLGSFTIFLDKPFIVGDNVKVGAVSGHVETIGLRSTRIRTYEKSLVTVPNKKMVDAELENITQRTLWRAKLTPGLQHTTSAADVIKIVDQIKNYLRHHPKIREDAAVNFDNIVPGALELLIVYFVRTVDADEFQAVKEEVNFKLLEIVHNNNSAFAISSSRLYVENGPLLIGGEKE